MSQSPQSQGESGYTSAMSDESANLPEWSEPVCDIVTNSSPTDTLSSSPWFHQEAVVLMGLITVICVFYLFTVDKDCVFCGAGTEI